MTDTIRAVGSSAIVQPRCEKCTRPGILFCQYVIPNKWEKATQTMIRSPWVFRAYYCRYHLAAENHPRSRRLGGKKRVRLDYRPDDELIANWLRLNDQDDSQSPAKNL